MLTRSQGYDSRNTIRRRGKFPYQILKLDMEHSLPEKLINQKLEIFGRFWGEGGFKLEGEDIK
jgi:hypothetical protein